MPRSIKIIGASYPAGIKRLKRQRVAQQAAHAEVVDEADEWGAPGRSCRREKRERVRDSHTWQGKKLWDPAIGE